MSINNQVILAAILSAILAVLGIGGVAYAVRAHQNVVTQGAYGQMSTILASAVEYYVVEGNVSNSKWLTADACTAIPPTSAFSKAYPSIPIDDQYGHPFEVCYFPATVSASEDYAVYDSNTGGTGVFPGFTLNNVTYSTNLSASSTTPFTPSANPPITCGNTAAKPNACVQMADDEAAGNLAE